MDKAQVTELFQWMALINIGILVFSTIMLISLKKFVAQSHARLFGLQAEQVGIAGYAWLGGFKIFVIVFNITPYLALRLL